LALKRAADLNFPNFNIGLNNRPFPNNQMIVGKDFTLKHAVDPNNSLKRKLPGKLTAAIKKCDG
jgi:hypothetical protein